VASRKWTHTNIAGRPPIPAGVRELGSSWARQNPRRGTAHPGELIGLHVLMGLLLTGTFRASALGPARLGA
jgi:hypothetical protein